MKINRNNLNMFEIKEQNGQIFKKKNSNFISRIIHSDEINYCCGHMYNGLKLYFKWHSLILQQKDIFD